MKSLIYVAEVVPGQGRGNVLHVLETVRALVKSGLRMELWVIDRGRMPEAPCPVVTIPTPRLGPWTYREFQRRVAARIMGLPENQLPDAFYQRFGGCGIRLPAAAHRRGRICVTEHNSDLGLENRLAARWWRRHVYGPWSAGMQIQTGQESDGNVFLTPQLAQLLVTRGIETPRLILPVGVDTERVRPAAESPESLQLARKWGLDDGPVILFIGNLARWQGTRILPPLMRLLLPRFPNLRLLVVGDGEEGDWLRAEAATIGDGQRIIVTGWVGDAEIPAWLGLGTVALLPRNRAFNSAMGVSPMKLFTFMAAGLAVVSSDLPGLEFLRDQDCGLLVPPEDPEALAAAVGSLLADPALRERLGAAARRVVVEEYDWQALTAKLIRFLESLPNPWKGAP